MSWSICFLVSCVGNNSGCNFMAFSKPVIVAYLLTNLCYGLLFRNSTYPTIVLFRGTRMLIYLLIFRGLCELLQINLKCFFVSAVHLTFLFVLYYFIPHPHTAVDVYHTGSE